MLPGSAVLIALAATLSVAAAFAAEPGAEPARQRLVCRSATRTLGSHIRTPRRCRTAEEWQQEDEAKARVPTSMQVTEGQNDGHGASAPQ